MIRQESINRMGITRGTSTFPNDDGRISGNEVSMCIGRIATVVVLKVGITKEDALRGLSRKFILAKSKYVDKTSASENMRRETKNGLIRKEKRMKNLIT